MVRMADLPVIYDPAAGGQPPAGFVTEDWCAFCEQETPQVVASESQGHSRAPAGSIFGFYVCTACGRGHGVCVNGELSHNTTPEAFRVEGLALDSSGDTA